MPYLLIVTDDATADPRKLAAAVDNGATVEAIGGDGWLAYVDLDDGDGDDDAKRRSSRARQRRYRARKRGDGVTRDVTRDDAQRYAGDASPRNADDAEILEIRPGSNSLSLGRERVTAENVTRNVTAVTRNGVTRGDASRVTPDGDDWRADRAPLDADGRARAQAGLAAARAALREKGRP
jgi:hypothetical protein